MDIYACIGKWIDNREKGLYIDMYRLVCVYS